MIVLCNMRKSQARYLMAFRPPVGGRNWQFGIPSFFVYFQRDILLILFLTIPKTCMFLLES